jgi:hypothetical protein
VEFEYYLVSRCTVRRSTRCRIQMTKILLIVCCIVQMQTMRGTRRVLLFKPHCFRAQSTAAGASKDNFKILVVGGGAHYIYPAK